MSFVATFHTYKLQPNPINTKNNNEACTAFSKMVKSSFKPTFLGGSGLTLSQIAISKFLDVWKVKEKR